MDSYAVEGLVREIKNILDRNQENAELIPTDSDTLSQGEIIKSKLVDATKLIESNASLQMLSGYSYKDNGSLRMEANNGMYVGKVPLPKDLLRLLSVRMSGWERPAKIISELDDEYGWQSNRFGVRGNPQRPIAAVVQSNGDLQLELYTCKTATETLNCTYIPIPYIDNGVIFMCKKLKESILYMAASLVCTTLGDTDTASSLKSTAFELANITELSKTQ